MRAESANVIVVSVPPSIVRTTEAGMIDFKSRQFCWGSLREN